MKIYFRVELCAVLFFKYLTLLVMLISRRSFLLAVFVLQLIIVVAWLLLLQEPCSISVLQVFLTTTSTSTTTLFTAVWGSPSSLTWALCEQIQQEPISRHLELKDPSNQGGDYGGKEGQNARSQAEPETNSEATAAGSRHRGSGGRIKRWVAW